jgi:hypothetical protein
VACEEVSTSDIVSVKTTLAAGVEPVVSDAEGTDAVMVL